MALALQAHAHGAKVRIVERRAEAFRPSRALNYRVSDSLADSTRVGGFTVDVA
jgi:hypothetical protein